MAHVEFRISSARPPEDVLADLVDFSSRRPEVWPAIDPGVYQVHAIGDTWAEVTEGSDVMGGIWARERYDWATPGVVRATVQEANLWHPGGTWALRASADPQGGSILEVTRSRTARTLKGRLLETLLRVVGRKMLAADLRKAPAISGQPPVAAPPPGVRAG